MDAEKKSNVNLSMHDLQSLVQTHPGIRYNDLLRLSKLPNGTLGRMLSDLEYSKKIFISHDGGKTRIFPFNMDELDIKIIEALKQETLREIIECLSSEKELTFKKLVGKIDKSPSTISVSLKKLYSSGLVKRKNEEISFLLNNPSLINSLILKYSGLVLDGKNL